MLFFGNARCVGALRSFILCVRPFMNSFENYLAAVYMLDRKSKLMFQLVLMLGLQKYKQL